MSNLNIKEILSFVNECWQKDRSSDKQSPFDPDKLLLSVTFSRLSIVLHCSPMLAGVSEMANFGFDSGQLDEHDH
jgi:hypothetical protein